MNIDESTMISMEEASRDFSRVCRIADAYGRAVIFKNNRPRYVLVDADSAPCLDMTDDEKIDAAAARILNAHRAAFEELAK